MDRRTIKDLKIFFSKIKQPRVDSLILFGSRATDDYLLTSDADVILVSNDFSGIPFPKRGTDLYLKWKGGAPLELLCYTPEEFEKKKNEIGTVADAVEKGIKIIP